MRHEIYCNECEAEFVIECLTLHTINYCPNCGADNAIDMDDEDDWADDEG
jgi:Zn finger protein HypA/HybF involved in hydrogenase expression